MDQPVRESNIPWAASKLLLSADELAGLLSISRATLWRWVSSGKIPGPILRQGQVVRWGRALRAQGRNAWDVAIRANRRPR